LGRETPFLNLINRQPKSPAAAAAKGEGGDERDLDADGRRQNVRRRNPHG
jgi:hypothetical protein